MSLYTHTRLAVSGVVAFAAALLLGGCEKEVSTESVGTGQITFHAYLDEGGKIKPLSRVFASDLATGYGLYGKVTSVPFGGTDANNYAWNLFNNVLMTASGSYQNSSEKPRYWVTDNAYYHSFAAYSLNPTGTESGYGVISVGGWTASHPTVYVGFKQHSDPMQQIDLLAATLYDIKVLSGAPSAVSLYFKHRLAKIAVKVYSSNGVALPNCQATLAYSSTLGPYNSGSVELNENVSITYNASTTRVTGTYNLGDAFSVKGTQTSAANAVQAGETVVMPAQKLTAGWATLTLTYTKEGSSLVRTASVDMPAFDLTYASGKEYRMYVGVSEYSALLSITSVTLQDWTAESGIIDQL